MIKLTDTQRTILTTAAHHPEGMAYPPTRLPTGARKSVAKALLRQGLVTASAPVAHHAIAVWMVDGERMVLQISEAGLAALSAAAAAADVPATMPEGTPGQEMGAKASLGPQDGHEGPTATDSPPNLRRACAAFLEAWDASPAQDTTDNAISRALIDLRTALQGRQQRASRPTGTTRQGTKQEAVLTLLRRPEGATIAQIMTATGWQQHTVRGFFAGLKKRQSINVEVLERVRQVGPGAQGSRGSHSVYAVAAGA